MPRSLEPWEKWKIVLYELGKERDRSIQNYPRRSRGMHYWVEKRVPTDRFVLLPPSTSFFRRANDPFSFIGPPFRQKIRQILREAGIVVPATTIFEMRTGRSATTALETRRSIRILATSGQNNKPELELELC